MQAIGGAGFRTARTETKLRFLNPASGAVLTIIIYVALAAGLGFAAGLLQSQIRQQAMWR